MTLNKILNNKRLFVGLSILVLIILFQSCSIINPFQTPIAANYGDPSFDGAGGGTPWEIGNLNIGMGSRMLHGVAVYNSNIWIVGGIDNNSNYLNDALYSSNGFDWTSVSLTGFDPSIAGYGSIVLIPFDSKLFAIATGFGPILSSTNGTNWSVVTNDKGFEGRLLNGYIVHNNIIWYIEPDRQGYYSTNGRDWVMGDYLSAIGERGSYTLTSFSNSLYLIGGEVYSPDYMYSNDIWISSNGTNWSYQGQAGFKATYETSYLLVHNSKLWMLGAYRTLDAWGIGDDYGIWSTENGASWQRFPVSYALDFHPRRNGRRFVSFDGKIWMIVCWSLDSTPSGWKYTYYDEIYWLDETATEN